MQLCMSLALCTLHHLILRLFLCSVQKTVTKPTYKEEIEKDWRLVLHDDTVHTIQQVCDIVSAVGYHEV